MKSDVIVNFGKYFSVRAYIFIVKCMHDEIYQSVRLKLCVCEINVKSGVNRKQRIWKHENRDIQSVVNNEAFHMIFISPISLEHNMR